MSIIDWQVGKDFRSLSSINNRLADFIAFSMQTSEVSYDNLTAMLSKICQLQNPKFIVIYFLVQIFVNRF